MLAIVSGMAFEAAAARGGKAVMPRLERSISGQRTSPGIPRLNRGMTEDSGDIIHTIYGLNPAKLAHDIEAAIAAGATHLLSFGTAAGLDPSLAPGAVVIAKQVQAHVADDLWVAELQRQLPEAKVGYIAGVDSAVTSVAAKAQLYAATGALATDMESHRVAWIAARHNLPFAALRIVLDDAACALPPAALAGARPDGTVNLFGVLGSLMAHPLQLPAMLRLAGKHAAAKKALLRCGGLLERSRFGLVNLR